MKNSAAASSINIIAGILITLAIIIAVVAAVRLDTAGKRGSGLSSQYTYDIGDIAEIDPALVLYEQTGPEIQTSLVESHELAVAPDDTIYVAGAGAVSILAPDGRFQSKFLLEATATSIAVDASGDIFVGLRRHIEVFDKDGARKATWPEYRENSLLTSIAVAAEDIFVADAGNRVVLRYDRLGSLKGTIGNKDANRNIDGLVVPSSVLDIAMGADGLLRVVNPGRLRVEVYTPDGDLEFFWGKTSMSIDGFCGCCNPVNIAMLADASCVTAEKGLVRVKIYDPLGNFIGVVATPQQLIGGEGEICLTVDACQKGNFDVAVNSRGDILVLDTVTNTVKIFSKKAGI